MSLILTPVMGIPLIQPGDDLSTIVISAVEKAAIVPQSGDIWIFAQKIVSKAENRLVNLSDG